jgi:hypothetical protein
LKQALGVPVRNRYHAPEARHLNHSPVWRPRRADDQEEDAMTDPASSEEAVLELNQRTFKAEDEPETAREILGDALSEDFSIVRAIGAVQGKQAMIDRVATDTSGNTRRIEQAEARVFGDAAVVLTCLTLLDRTGAEGKQYWNSKTFVRQDGDWRCVAWHVTERGPKGTACAPGGADSGT